MRWVAWTCALLVALVSRELHAQTAPTLLTVQFDTLGEQPPEQLYVLADYMTMRASQPGGVEHVRAELAADSFDAIDAETCVTSCKPVVANDTKDAEVNGNGAEPRALLLKGIGNGTAVLFVHGAEVSAADLQQDVARLTLRQTAKTAHAPTRVELLGGDYLPHSPVSIHLADSTQLVHIPLRRRCLARIVTMPTYSSPALCEEEPAGAQLDKDAARSGSTRPLHVHNCANGHGKVAISACAKKHTFAATWDGLVPPTHLRLEAEEFHFSWRTNCLSGYQCPYVGGGVSCGELPPPPTNGACEYTCRGPTQFPATVQFSFAPISSVERSWAETLNEPGQLLQSYIPEEQRRIHLDWRWIAENNVVLKCRPLETTPEQFEECRRQVRRDRARETGDRISYVELRSPEGNIRRIEPDANQIRVPELDCGDYVSYRYVGEDRIYVERSAKVDSQGIVRLQDPSKFRKDDFGVAAALGAGGRFVPAGGGPQWGPEVEAHLALVFRHLRDDLRFPLDIEFPRVAAILVQQPFCTDVGNTSAAACTDSNAWKRVFYWMVPVTLGADVLLNDKFSVGFNLGATFTTSNLTSDHDKVSRPVLPTLRLSVGYKLMRAITFEAQGWLFTGEDVRERRFDEFGVLRDLRASGPSLAVFPGAVLRVDDIFY